MFKDINDKLGHAAGDRYLKRITFQLKAAIREVDILARAGGDEFLILLPDTDPVAIEKTGEKILAAVRTASREAREEEVLLYANTHKQELPNNVGHVTASVGYAFFDPSRHTSADDVIRDADAAMYAAKQTGRNKLVAFVLGKVDFGEA